jgi:hypothetical protein
MMVLFYVLLFGHFPFDELHLTRYIGRHKLLLSVLFFRYHIMFCYKSQYLFYASISQIFFIFIDFH